MSGSLSSIRKSCGRALNYVPNALHMTHDPDERACCAAVTSCCATNVVFPCCCGCCSFVYALLAQHLIETAVNEDTSGETEDYI